MKHDAGAKRSRHAARGSDPAHCPRSSPASRGDADRRPTGGKTSETAGDGRRALGYSCALVLVGICVWATGVDGVFLYDDYDSIALNPHIRVLWPLSEAMSRPLANSAETVSTRPLLSYTFALNYAAGGLAVGGYHVVNIAVHLACALLLFGLLRRTLVLPSVTSPARTRAGGLAFAIVLLWMVHPLLTSSVTYVVQRAEALGALFILLALYSSLRGAVSDRPAQSTGWYAAAVAACWLGAGAKETIAAVPLLALVHHATFVDPSYRAALASRWPVYLAMAASWSLLWMLRSSDTGELVAGGHALEYLATQPSAVLHYLRLAIWPHPLAMSYDWPNAGAIIEVLPPALVVAALAAATVIGVVRRRSWGLPGACFFGVLAPSSSVFALTQRVMEHRMYLPLAAVISVLVIAAHTLVAARTRATRVRSTADGSGGGAGTASAEPATSPWMLALAALVALTAIALAAATVARNRDYRDEIRFWAKNAAAEPTDSIAQLQLGRAYLRTGRISEARTSFDNAIRLGPPFAPVYNDLARTLIAQGDLEGADQALGRALELDPTLAVAVSNRALIAGRRGDTAAAREGYRRALALDPTLAIARESLADLLARSGDAAGGAALLEAAPTDQADALLAAGALLERNGLSDEARARYEQALAADARNLRAANALATLLARRGEDAEAVRHFESVLAVDPGNVDALLNLGALHAMHGRDDEALRRLEAAADAAPAAPRVHFNLGLLHEKRGELERAAAELTREVEIAADFAPAHAALARVLERSGDTSRAAQEYTAALRLAPDLADARDGVARLSGGGVPLAGQGRPVR